MLSRKCLLQLTLVIVATAAVGNALDGGALTAMSIRNQEIRKFVVAREQLLNKIPQEVARFISETQTIVDAHINSIRQRGWRYDSTFEYKDDVVSGFKFMYALKDFDETCASRSCEFPDLKPKTSGSSRLRETGSRDGLGKHTKSQSLTSKKQQKGEIILLIFGLAIFIFAVLTLIHYSKELQEKVYTGQEIRGYDFSKQDQGIRAPPLASLFWKPFQKQNTLGQCPEETQQSITFTPHDVFHMRAEAYLQLLRACDEYAKYADGHEAAMAEFNSNVSKASLSLENAKYIESCLGMKLRSETNVQGTTEISGRSSRTQSTSKLSDIAGAEDSSKSLTGATEGRDPSTSRFPSATGGEGSFTSRHSGAGLSMSRVQNTIRGKGPSTSRAPITAGGDRPSSPKLSGAERGDSKSTARLSSAGGDAGRSTSRLSGTAREGLSISRHPETGGGRDSPHALSRALGTEHESTFGVPVAAALPATARGGDVLEPINPKAEVIGVSDSSVGVSAGVIVGDEESGPHLSPDQGTFLEKEASPDKQGASPDKQGASPDKQGASPDKQGASPDQAGML